MIGCGARLRAIWSASASFGPERLWITSIVLNRTHIGTRVSVSLVYASMSS
jgi:hypothetical protein